MPDLLLTRSLKVLRGSLDHSLALERIALRIGRAIVDAGRPVHNVDL